MHEKIKNFIGFGLGLFLVIASIFVGYVLFVLEDLRATITKTNKIIDQSNIASTLTNINSTSKAIEESSLAVKEVSLAQQKLLTDKKTQDGIALLLRQGNDLAHTVTKVNLILDRVNRETIPKVNTTLDSTNRIINTSNDVVIRLANKTELILSDTDKTIVELRELLADPNIQRAIAGVAEAAQAGGQNCAHSRGNQRRNQSCYT